MNQHIAIQVFRQEWDRLLPGKPGNDTSNFLNDGGDSLKAMQLATALETKCDVLIPPDIILSTAARKDLEERIIKIIQTPPRGGDGRAIAADGVVPDVYLFPGAGGDIEPLRDLIDVLQNRANVTVINSAKNRLYDHKSNIQLISEGIAADIVDRGNHAVQVVGWCLGGIMAHALACALERRGAKIVALSLIESEGPRNEEESNGSTESSKFHRIVQAVKRKGLSQALRRGRLVLGRRAFFAGLSAMRAMRFQIPKRHAAAWHRYCDIKAANSYKPAAVYNGDITIFWSAKDPEWEWFRRENRGPRYFDAGTAQRRWETVSRGSIELIEIAGDHVSMLMQPAVQVVADRLLRPMDDVPIRIRRCKV